MSVSEPSLADLNDLTPLVASGVRIELRGLCDASGSNASPLVENGSGQRWEYVGGVWRQVAFDTSHLDAMSSAEGGHGGVNITTFADMPNPRVDQRRLNVPTVRGDFNPENFDELWGAIPIGGHTYSVPGLRVMLDDTGDEFASKPKSEQPDVVGVLCTNDGLLDDLDDFIEFLDDMDTEALKLLRFRAEVKLVVAVYGYGNEGAIRKYRGVEQRHPGAFRCLQLAPSTRPREVSNAMLSILGKPVLAA